MRARWFVGVLTVGLTACWLLALGLAGFSLVVQGGYGCRHETPDQWTDWIWRAYFTLWMLLWSGTAFLALGCWRQALGTARSRLVIALALLHALVGSPVGLMLPPCS